MKKINWTAVSSVLFSGVSSVGLALATASYTTSSSNAFCRKAYNKGEIDSINGQPYHNPYDNVNFVHPGILGASSGVELLLPSLFSLYFIYRFAQDKKRYKNVLAAFASFSLACTAVSLTNYYINKQNAEAAMYKCFEMGFKKQPYQDYSNNFALNNALIALDFFLFSPATMIASFVLAFYAGIQNKNNESPQRRSRQRPISPLYSAHHQPQYQSLSENTIAAPVPITNRPGSRLGVSE